MLNVFPCQKHCKFCKGGWCDIKGDHATMCGGGSSRNLRHNNMRNIIAKAARDVGFKADFVESKENSLKGAMVPSKALKNFL